MAITLSLVLIETYWNVKVNGKVWNARWIQVLIETYWNVKTFVRMF